MQDVFKYVSGLSVGNPGERVIVRVEDGDLTVSVPKWTKTELRSRVPVSGITGMQLDTAERLSKGRLLMTGIFAFAWKKKDYFLVIETQESGIDTQIIFSGGQRELEELRQKIVREKERSPSVSREPSVKQDVFASSPSSEQFDCIYRGGFVGLGSPHVRVGVEVSESGDVTITAHAGSTKSGWQGLIRARQVVRTRLWFAEGRETLDIETIPDAHTDRNVSLSGRNNVLIQLQRAIQAHSVRHARFDGEQSESDSDDTSWVHDKRAGDAYEFGLESGLPKGELGQRLMVDVSVNGDIRIGYRGVMQQQWASRLPIRLVSGINIEPRDDNDWLHVWTVQADGPDVEAVISGASYAIFRFSKKIVESASFRGEVGYVPSQDDPLEQLMPREDDEPSVHDSTVAALDREQAEEEPSLQAGEETAETSNQRRFDKERLQEQLADLHFHGVLSDIEYVLNREMLEKM